MMLCWQEIAKDILEQQSPKQIHVVRSKLYELLVNCLPPELILRKLSQELMSKLDDELRHKCSAAAAQYEHRLQVRATCLRSWFLEISDCKIRRRPDAVQATTFPSFAGRLKSYLPS